jgi:hypothetical protein
MRSEGYKCPINPITNPNAIYSHSTTWQYIKGNITDLHTLPSSIDNCNISTVYNLQNDNRVETDISLGREGGGRLFNDAVTFYIYIVGWQDNWWIAIWKGFVRRRVWPIRDTIPVFATMDWEKQRKTSVGIACDLAAMRTMHNVLQQHRRAMTCEWVRWWNNVQQRKPEETSGNPCCGATSPTTNTTWTQGSMVGSQRLSLRTMAWRRRYCHVTEWRQTGVRIGNRIYWTL